MVLDERYKIVSRIAAGSMGVIYKGERLRLGRSVAIKILQASLASEKKFVQRFELEAKALSRLGHPNCVSIIDFGVADAPYLVMDYVQGSSLKELLEREGLPPPRALHIFRQVLAALAHAHGHGIIHRDVKPGNIMLTEATGTGDHIRILDFGLAKIQNAALAVAMSLGKAKVVGTPAYMSPEQARGKAVDLRSDLYSAGVMLFELLTGTKPFWSDDTMELLRMQAEDRPPRLRQVESAPKLSAEIEAVTLKGMAKAPDQRYQTALEFVAALEQTPEAAQPLLRFYGVQAAAPAPTSAGGSTATTTSLSGGRGPLWALVALLVLALAGAAVWYLVLRPGGQAAVVVVKRSAEGGDAGASTAARDDLQRSAPTLRVDAQEPGGAAPTPPGRVDAVAPATPIDARAEAAATPAATPPSGGDVRRLADVRALLKAGQPAAALKGLRRLRYKHPKNAYIPFMLGKLYFQRRWWSEGIKAYASALRLDASYRRRRTINEDLIEALGSPATSNKARRLIVSTIKSAALPYLKRAAKKHSVAKVRGQCAALARHLER